MADVTSLGNGLHGIDLHFQGLPGVIAAYLIEDGDELALIETGPTTTLDSLIRGLESVSIDPSRISKLLVTHIHLDHAGAAGTFMQRFPRARLYAHEIGVPHLIDPEKLLSSATRIYGDRMDSLWGPVVPVPADRVTAVADNDVIRVGRRTLKVLYTPGHASHHVAYHDPENRAIFTGDVAAVRLQGESFVRPPTPPPDIDLELWTASIQRLRDANPTSLLLTHFGRFTDVDRHLSDAHSRLLAWAEVVRRAQENGQDRTEMVDTLRLEGDRELLGDRADATLARRYDLATPYGMTVDGYLRYFKQQSRAAAASGQA